MASNVKFELSGVGDVEAECYQNLRAGQRVLLWYSDDTVWHAAMIGLVIGFAEAVIFTPDDALYIEKLGCKGTGGPTRLRGLGRRLGYCRGPHGRIYPFRVPPTNDLIRKVLRDSIQLVEEERGSIILPVTVISADGSGIGLDAFYGGNFF